MKRYLFAGLMVSCGLLPVAAQSSQSFEQFRSGLFDDYNNFKTRILKHYADFLAGEWHEYEAMEAQQKYSQPKPEAIPVAERIEADAADEQQKEMLDIFGFNKRPDFTVPDFRKESETLKWIRKASSLYNAKSFQMAREEIDAEDEASPVAEIVTADGFVGSYDGDVFDFYGMCFGLPGVDFEIKDALTSTLDYSYQWRSLQEQNVAERVLPGVVALQKATGLSDYLIFEMLMAYLDSKFADANDASKMSAAHYLLANMGFGVRIAMDDNGQPFMLIPFTEDIFGRTGFRMSATRTYYVYSVPGREVTRRMGLSTPVLPDNVDDGMALNLRMEGLSLPFKPYHYAFEYEGLKLEGDMNENVIPMLYRYPQMDTGGFAATMISPEVREDVVRQVREQLGEGDPMRGADRLLAMIQFAFPYATDDNFHGFEKPYFFEESLYYPKSDCEDRAVFYSYLLWNALGLENDLIAYPYHEATAIKADKVWGGNAHYIDNDSKYFISDPTFQGSPTGQCMKKFLYVVPKIDLRYSNDMRQPELE